MDATGLVERAIELLAGDSTDADIAEALISEGVSAEHARAAVVFTTLAFGRVALQHAGPQFDRCYSVDSESHILAEHPLYVEALLAALRCDKERFQSIALRSSETDAINAAAHAGSKLADLTLSPPVLDGAWAGGRDLESNARSELVAESDIAREKVLEAFAAHGAEGLEVEVRIYSGVVRPSAISVQLDVQVKHTSIGERFILESVGGIGKGIDAAITNALGRFFSGSLHAIIGALVDESLTPDQIEIEELVGWRAIMGPALHQMKVPEAFQYEELLDKLLETFCQSEPENCPHWIRIYYMRGPDGPYGLDVLVDNEHWAEGADIVESWPWPWEGNAYAIRHFLFLRPAKALS